MVSSDTAVAGEQDTLRRGCGLVDRSERGRLALSGAGAAEFLNGQVTNDVGALEPGHGCYAALLTHKGKMLADLRVLAPPPDVRLPVPGVPALLLDTERVALQALFDTIRRSRIGHDVELHKLTLETVALSLEGPRADEIVRSALGGGEPPGPVEHDNRTGLVARAPVLVVRTDAGIDVIGAVGDGPALVDVLVEAGARAVSHSAAEVLRVERGRPRYGIDLDDSVIPQEAGLNERAVSFTKGCYVGQETVARLFYKGKPNRFLRGLRLSAPAPTGAELLAGERVVGRVGSSVISSELGPIGLALVRREVAPGDDVEVADQGGRATVVRLPFSAAAPAGAA